MYEDLAALPGSDLVPGDPPGSRAGARRWPALLAGVATVVVAGLLVAAAFIRLPYVIVSPGDATPLDDQVIQVQGAPSFPHEGELLFLTVTVSTRDPNLYRWLFASLDPDASVQRRQEVIGCAGYPESERLAREQMAQSQDVAKAVALRRLGYTVDEDPSRVRVIDVVCGGPSQGRLELGDVITHVDGIPVTRADEVRPLVVAHQPGDEIHFGIERDGVRQTVGVRLGRRDGQAFAGIAAQTEHRHRTPVDVRIDAMRVSGPSAGLAFALAIIDDLTPGDLTGGKDVAVTGTILEDGSVGEVGGLAQKAVTARRAGARLMLVPKSEAADARAHAGAMKVVGVATLDDALRALQRAGGDRISAASPSGQ